MNELDTECLPLMATHSMDSIEVSMCPTKKCKSAEKLVEHKRVLVRAGEENM